MLLSLSVFAWLVRKQEETRTSLQFHRLRRAAERERERERTAAEAANCHFNLMPLQNYHSGGKMSQPFVL